MKETEIIDKFEKIVNNKFTLFDRTNLEYHGINNLRQLQIWIDLCNSETTTIYSEKLVDNFDNLNIENCYINLYLTNSKESLEQIYILFSDTEEIIYYFCSISKRKSIEELSNYLQDNPELAKKVLKDIEPIKYLFFIGRNDYKCKEAYIKGSEFTDKLENVVLYFNIDDNFNVSFKILPENLSEEKIKEFGNIIIENARFFIYENVTFYKTANFIEDDELIIVSESIIKKIRENTPDFLSDVII